MKALYTRVKSLGFIDLNSDSPDPMETLLAHRTNCFPALEPLENPGRGRGKARSMAFNGRNNRRGTPCVSLDSPAPSVVRREALPAPSEAMADFQAMRWTRFLALCPPRAPTLPRAACAKCT